MRGYDIAQQQMMQLVKYLQNYKGSKTVNVRNAIGHEFVTTAVCVFHLGMKQRTPSSPV